MNEFKLIVAGGRDFRNKEALKTALETVAEYDLTNYLVSIVSGMARGADALGYQFAIDNSVAVYQFPAKWDIHGKAAGMIRNEEMGKFADGALIFWDGQSKGTKHMIKTMRALNKPIWQYDY